MAKKKQAKKDPKEANPAPGSTLGSNIIQATGGQKKKKRDVFEVTCCSYNKKGHYIKDYTKPKN